MGDRVISNPVLEEQLKIELEEKMSQEVIDKLAKAIHKMYD